MQKGYCLPPGKRGRGTEACPAYEKALKISPSFVRTDAYGRALEILDLTHVVVISGEAGMGEDYYSLYIGHGLFGH